MAKYALPVGRVFHALGDPTRQAVVDRLSAGPVSVGELAVPFEMALPSFMKHIRQLELAGLITTSKVGRVRTCTLQPAAMAVAESWLARQREVWERRTDRLEHFVATSQPREPIA
ncbi:helix-turn-helix transcriptional regulator [Micrococcaceae bacterium RIT802]|nr:helix-turn-helix transcriptional regulator [Micrococcaceae bacterium RIT 802]